MCLFNTTRNLLTTWLLSCSFNPFLCWDYYVCSHVCVESFNVILRSIVTWEIREWQARVTMMSSANHNSIKDATFSLPILGFCLYLPLARVGEIRPLLDLQDFRLRQRNSSALAKHRSTYYCKPEVWFHKYCNALGSCGCVHLCFPSVLFPFLKLLPTAQTVSNQNIVSA